MQKMMLSLSVSLSLSSRQCVATHHVRGDKIFFVRQESTKYLYDGDGVPVAITHVECVSLNYTQAFLLAMRVMH